MKMVRKFTSLGAAGLAWGLLAAAPLAALAEVGTQQDRMYSTAHQLLDAPQSEPVKDSADAKSGDTKRYYVQFGAFSQYANAQSLVQQLHNSGIGSVQIVKRHDNDRLGVWSGPFDSSSSAKKLQARGRAIGLDATVLTKQRRS